MWIWRYPRFLLTLTSVGNGFEKSIFASLTLCTSSFLGACTSNTSSDDDNTAKSLLMQELLGLMSLYKFVCNSFNSFVNLIGIIIVIIIKLVVQNNFTYLTGWINLSPSIMLSLISLIIIALTLCLVNRKDTNVFSLNVTLSIFDWLLSVVGLQINITISSSLPMHSLLYRSSLAFAFLV